jgi:branched-chain amino acid transport system substrate-binding protein
MKAQPKVLWGQDAGFEAPEFLQTLGEDVEGILTRTVFSPRVGEVKKVAGQVNAMYKAKVGRDLSGASARAFTGVQTWAAVLEKAGSTKPEAIRKALAETNLSDGPASIVPFSPIRFDDKGQAKETTVIMIQYRDGQRQTVWPEKVKALDPVVPFPKWDGR